MRLHELDWARVLVALPRWEALSPQARRGFLDAVPGKSFPLEALGAAGPELCQAGLLAAPTGRGTLYRVDVAAQPLHSALRAAHHLHPLHAGPGMLSPGYVQDQLHSEQATRIGAPGREWYDARDRQAAAEAASSVAWLRGFLAAGSHEQVVAWEARWLISREKPRLVIPAVAAALRTLVEALVGRPGGVPLRELPALVPDGSPTARAAALAAGLRYLLVFVSVGPELEPTVGLLPPVAERAAGPAPPPAPVQAHEVFCAPFRVGDMTAVLVEAATEAIPVRASTHTLFVRRQNAVADRLASVPAWVARFCALGAPPPEDTDPRHGEDADEESRAYRVGVAAQNAELLGMATVRTAGGRMRYEATRIGRAWLARGEGERLCAVLDALRGSPQRSPTGYDAGGRLDFFGTTMSFYVDERTTDLRARLTEAFLSVPAGAMVSVRAFLRWQSREQNPFIGASGVTVRLRYWTSAAPTVEAWEQVWAELLAGFLARRLVPLGGAALGLLDDGSVAFGLTDAGRYLLGGTDDFTLPEDAAGDVVVVQPDFEIVFLAPAPRIEAEIARVAERTGTGVGALFRLTRASVLRAAEQGLSAEQVLDALEGASRAGAPANVARQVRDWMASIRRVRIAPAVLVECPDPETAAQVRAIGGTSVTPLTPTLLRLDADPRARAALVKRLRDRGIFPDPDGAAPAAEERAPRPRRRRR